MEGFDEDERPTMTEQLDLVESDLGTAVSGIDMGARDGYLREGLAPQFGEGQLPNSR